MNVSQSDIEFFLKMLEIDSTSGKERKMAEWLVGNLKTDFNDITVQEVGDGTLNVIVKWGNPSVWFCSHCDTVPPYIPPVREGGKIKGRGTCDAKGQIFSMFMACKELEKRGYTDFGLLVLAGEETGSFGAKAYDRDFDGAEAIIVGEPTGNAMVKASKGTRSFSVTIQGEPCHSGYPHLGESAVLKFNDFLNSMKRRRFRIDPVLGETTWNIGQLHSPNPQNILSGELWFNIYFRTTFATRNSDKLWKKLTDALPAPSCSFDNGGDEPMTYFTFDDIPQTVVAFGSDAPRLTKFEKRILCGPGDIAVAHTDNEYIDIEEINMAVRQYVEFATRLLPPKV